MQPPPSPGHRPITGARGDDTDESDLDLWIDVPPGFTLLDFAGLQLDLEALLGVPVDLGTGFRTQAITEGVMRDAKPL